MKIALLSILSLFVFNCSEGVNDVNVKENRRSSVFYYENPLELNPDASFIRTYEFTVVCHRSEWGEYCKYTDFNIYKNEKLVCTLKPRETTIIRCMPNNRLRCEYVNTCTDSLITKDTIVNSDFIWFIEKI